MKTTTHKLQVLAMLLGLGLSSQVFAQSADILEDTDAILNSDQIDIDGAFEQPRESAAQRIEKMRKQLEKKNEEMVSKKIEDMRIKEEQKLAKKLQKAFNGGNLGNVDTVSTTQAAPAQVVAPAPVVEEKKEEAKRNKIIPVVGVTSFSSETIEFESKINAGIMAESLLTDRIAMGVGLVYSTMDVSIGNGSYYNGNPYYNNNAFNNRQMNYTNFNIEANSKFFITGIDSKFRPYVGAALGYNRSKLKFDNENNNNNYYNNQYNNYNNADGVTGSNVNGSILGGVEVAFGDTIGLTLDARYTRALTSGFDKENINNNNQQSQDEIILNSYGSEIEDANQLSFGLGLVVKF